MQVVIIHLMNSATITFVHITKIHTIHMIRHGNQYTNINKENENEIDYRKQEPKTICYIEPSRIGPTIINGKHNIFKKKTIDGTTLIW